jgi:hypothetical protein
VGGRAKAASGGAWQIAGSGFGLRLQVDLDQPAARLNKGFRSWEAAVRQPRDAAIGPVCSSPSPLQSPVLRASLSGFARLIVSLVQHPLRSSFGTATRTPQCSGRGSVFVRPGRRIERIYNIRARLVAARKCLRPSLDPGHEVGSGKWPILFLPAMAQVASF